MIPTSSIKHFLKCAWIYYIQLSPFGRVDGFQIFTNIITWKLFAPLPQDGYRALLGDKHLFQLLLRLHFPFKLLQHHRLRLTLGQFVVFIGLSLLFIVFSCLCHVYTYVSCLCSLLVLHWAVGVFFPCFPKLLWIAWCTSYLGTWSILDAFLKTPMLPFCSSVLGS